VKAVDLHNSQNSQADVQKRDVPFFRYTALIKQNEVDVRARMEDVLSRGAFILQKDLVEFEKNLASFLGIKHVIGVANGTDALIIALKAAGIRDGDEVILPSHTFIATAAAVKMCGGVPVLVDCTRDHLVDPALMARAVTAKTRFLMPVQLNGRTANMDLIQEIANKHKLEIIEDSAQALGSKFKGKTAGSFGKAGMISFYPAKVLGCFGDGGAITTNDDDMAHQMMLLREHGRDPKTGQVVAWGLNSRLDNLHAAVLDAQLKHYPEVMKRRRTIASMYQQGLTSLKEVL
jgi:dTDP-4-amino-4,6-dideoxygalactose transaminase